MRTRGLLASLLILLCACGEPPVSAEEAALARLEARWQCDVQRQAFTDVEAIGAARSEFFTAAGIDTDRYQDFLAQLPERARLRQAVTEAYQELCS